MGPSKIGCIVSMIFIISIGSQIESTSSHPMARGAAASADGSKCPGTSCVQAPSGTECEARYLEDDNCCPRWVCANGQTAYGRSTAMGVAWKSGDGTSSGYSYSSGTAVSDGLRYGASSAGAQQAPAGYSETMSVDNGNGHMSMSSYSSSSSSSNSNQNAFGHGQQGYGVLRPITNPFAAQQATAVAMFGGGFFGR
ncbi:unnamed protein product [Orchesella dallaii]|uniref:Uncharacterized protein n=1 Tax=Orchesella dallaii TaxID=48710 RepID=A0ABP1QRD1_9HEXA